MQSQDQGKSISKKCEITGKQYLRNMQGKLYTWYKTMSLQTLLYEDHFTNDIIKWEKNYQNILEKAEELNR